MKIRPLLSFVGSLIVPLIAHAQVVDDFSSADLSAYTFIRVNDDNAETNISFESAWGGLTAICNGETMYEQVLFLRNDVALKVGSTLTVDVNFDRQDSMYDFGIAVADGAEIGPIALPDDQIGDTRQTASWAAVYVRPHSDSVRNSFLNATTPDTVTGVLHVSATAVGKLFIRRATETRFDLGYIDRRGREIIGNTVTFTSGSVGARIGFYADLRTNGAKLGRLDNLAIVTP